jgi:hypothetical protein
MGCSQGGWVGLARGRLGADDRGVGGVSCWADGGRSLRVGRSLSGDARAVGLNRRGRSPRLRGRGGRSGRDNRAGLGGGHVAWSGGSDGGRVAGVVLGGLESLDRGGADSGLGGRSAVDLVSKCYCIVLWCRESVSVQWRRSIRLPSNASSLDLVTHGEVCGRVGLVTDRGKGG